MDRQIIPGHSHRKGLGGSQAHLVIHATLTVALWVREREREVSQCLHTARATGYMWASMASHISARRDNVKEQGQMEEITWLVSLRKGRL